LSQSLKNEENTTRMNDAKINYKCIYFTPNHYMFSTNPYQVWFYYKRKFKKTNKQ